MNVSLWGPEWTPRSWVPFEAILKLDGIYRRTEAMDAIISTGSPALRFDAIVERDRCYAAAEEWERWMEMFRPSWDES